MIMYLVLGVVGGCIGVSILWAILFTGRVRSLEAANSQRAEIAAKLDTLCTAVESMAANLEALKAPAAAAEAPASADMAAHIEPRAAREPGDAAESPRHTVAAAGVADQRAAGQDQAAVAEEEEEEETFEPQPLVDDGGDADDEADLAVDAGVDAPRQQGAAESGEIVAESPDTAVFEKPGEIDEEKPAAGETSGNEQPAAPMASDEAEMPVSDQAQDVERETEDDQTSRVRTAEDLDEEEAFYASANKYVPIEETGLLSDDEPAASAGDEEETFEIDVAKPSQQPHAENLPEAAEQTKSADDEAPRQQPEARDDFEFDVQQTQICTKDAFSKMAQPEQDTKQPAESAADVDEDSQIGADFIFGDDESASAGEPSESDEDYFEIEAAAPQQQAANAPSEQEAPRKDAADDDDSLITGEDVIKKMDDFFNFS